MEETPTSRTVDVSPWDADALLEWAAKAGYDVVRKDLEYFVKLRLMPGAERVAQNGKQPILRYPHDSAVRLQTILFWRSRRVPNSDVKVLLWLQGFDVPLGEVRPLLAAWIDDAIETVNRAMQRFGLAAVGEQLARARTSARHLAPPRLTRMTAPRRFQGMLALLRVGAFGEPAGTAEEERAVEEVIGASRGRRRTGMSLPAWVTEPVSLKDLAAIGSLPALRQAIITATDEELRTARRDAAAFYFGLWHLHFAMRTLSRAQNPGGLGLVALIPRMPRAALWTTAFTINARRYGWSGNLDAVVSAFEQLIAQSSEASRLLGNLGDVAFDERLRTLSRADRERLQRFRKAWKQDPLPPWTPKVTTT